MKGSRVSILNLACLRSFFPSFTIHGKKASDAMGSGASSLKVLPPKERTTYIEHTPFYLYLDNDLMREFVDCFPNFIKCKAGDKVTLEHEKVYIIAKGRLELQTTLPGDNKVECSAYLCKKFPGDIISKTYEEKRAVDKLPPKSSRKMMFFVDQVETIACEDSLLIYSDGPAFHSFLAKHNNLADPFDAVVCSHIEAYLSKLPFLYDVKESKLSVLAQMCRYEALDANTVIFKEGDHGDKLYILLNGAATISVHGPSRRTTRGSLLQESLGMNEEQNENDEIVVAQLTSGDYFGETSVLVNIGRTSTVKTTEKSLFVTVEKTMFENFCAVCPIRDSMRQVMAERMLSKLTSLGIPFLDGISDESFKSLTDQVEIHEPEDGDVIFRQGDVGDRFYIIVHGSVRVQSTEMIMNKEQSKSAGDSEEADSDGEITPMMRRKSEVKRSELLHAGSYFGEMALASDKPRSATVTVNGKTILLSVDKDSFLTIFASSKNALAEFTLRLLRKSSELKHVLAHSFGRSMFRNYLKRNFADENIDFWIAANEYKNKTARSNNNDSSESDRSKEDLSKMAKDIFDTYCKADAQRQINLPHSIRAPLEKSLEEGPITADLFDPSIDEIYNLMVRDNYVRFKKAPDFKEFFKCLGLIDLDV